MPVAPDRPAGAADSVPRGAGRAAITAAATEIFAERGYHGASIRDIARRAGLSLSALYHWHASKQELLAALIEEHTNEYFRACEEELRRVGNDPVEQLCAMVRVVVRFRIRRKVASNVAGREWQNLPPTHHPRLDQLRRRATKLWVDIIEAGCASGQFACQYPDDARRAILAACNAISQWYDPNGEVTPAELVRRYTEIALRIVEHDPTRRRAGHGGNVR